MFDSKKYWCFVIFFQSVASGMTVATAGSLGKKAAKLQLASGILDIFKLDPLIGATVARVNKVRPLMFQFYH